MAHRHILRIELSGVAKNNLESLSDKHGMTQVAMLSRLVECFAVQDELIQSALMGRFAQEDALDVAQMILKRMATGNART